MEVCIVVNNIYVKQSEKVKSLYLCNKDADADGGMTKINVAV